jgi:hypothetical protein
LLLTRLLAAAGDEGLPFSSFEATLRTLREQVADLAGVSFGTYADGVVYSSQIRAALDEALGRDWVRFENQRLRPTSVGLTALEQERFEPRQDERDALARLAA